jgi:8-oxo-dGTP pyrophosphatase MutT (NUDIX family)
MHRMATGEDAGWRVHGKTIPYENPWIRVHEYVVTRPDGTSGIYGVVDAGQNAGAVVVDAHGRVALLREWVFPLQTFALQIPSGQFRDESPLAACQRELREETGIEAAQWNGLGTFALSGGISTQVGHLFLARELTVGPPQQEATEVMELTWIPLADVVARCVDGTIQDSVSLVGLFRAAAYLHRVPLPARPKR